MDVEVQRTAEALDQRNQMLDVAALATYPQEAMFQPSAVEVILELAPDIRRQFPALLRQMGSEYRVMLFDNPIEKGLLGTVAPVTTSIPLPGSRPGRLRVSIFQSRYEPEEAAIGSGLKGLKG